MSIKEKISSLGLSLPTAAAPVAAYVPAVKSGNLVFTAGQLPVVDGKLLKEWEGMYQQKRPKSWLKFAR
jgi:enamine deaminase RidA (YjgF/YER057c/UK114 family)